MKELISKGLTIEQLEERMEFTAMGFADLTPDELAAAHEAGYSDADLAKPPGCNCPHTTYFKVGPS